MRKSPKYEAIELKFGKPMPVLLKSLFEQHGSQSAVAKVLGVTQASVSLWCAKLGLKQVTRLEPADRPDYSALFKDVDRAG